MAKFVLSAFADEAGSSLSEQIAALKRNGIRYIEPRNIDGRGILTYSDEELKEIKKSLDEAGIKVNSLGSPIGKYPIEADFEEHFELTKKAIKTAKALGTNYIRMFSFFTKQTDLSKYRDEVISRLTKMCDEAAKEGVTLCHENESEIYGQMPNEVLDILSSVPKLGGIFDPANYRMHGADPIEGIKATFKNFKYMHIKDAIFEEQMIVPAGEGEGRIAEVINLINDSTDELVYLTLEPHLHSFDAYKDIDKHELRGKYTFNSNAESFDFAANALKTLLTNNGYIEGENNVWNK